MLFSCASILEGQVPWRTVKKCGMLKSNGFAQTRPLFWLDVKMICDLFITMSNT